jgi:hypothetical protein
VTHPQARGSHHGAGGGGPNTCAVRAHDAQKLVRAKRALGAASAASKRVIDATRIPLTAAIVAIGAAYCLPVNWADQDALAAATSGGLWAHRGNTLPLAHIKGVAIQLALRVAPAGFGRGRDVVSQVHVFRKGCPS